MKKNKLLLISVVAACAVLLTAGATEAADPIGHWTLDGEPNDSSGNGYDGVLVNGPVYVTGKDGLPATAIRLDGVNDYINLSAHAAGLSAPSDFSLSLWIKGGVVPPNGCFFSWSDGSNSHRMIIGIYSGSLYVGGDEGGGWHWLAPALTWNNSTWYHIVCTSSATGGKILYRDAVPVGSDPAYTAGPAQLGATVTTVAMGCQHAGVDTWFQGDLDEVRLYDYALSVAEIKELAGIENLAPTVDAGEDQLIYLPELKVELQGSAEDDGEPIDTLTYKWTQVDGPNDVTFFPSDDVLDPNVTLVGIGIYTFKLEVSDSELVGEDTVEVTLAPEGMELGLLGYWKFEESGDIGDPGTKAIDSTFYGNDGIIHGDPNWVEGVFGDALAFDGDGDYVEIPNESHFDVTTDMTVMCWVKVTAFDIGWQTIMSKNNEPGWRLVRYGTGNNLHFGWNGWGSTIGEVNVNDGEWHHVAVTVCATGTSQYIDGLLDDFAAGAGSGALSNTPITIGTNGQFPELYWHGLIDEVKIYDRALSDIEIAQIVGLDRLCVEKLAGDFNGDCYVDLADVAELASAWLDCNNMLDAECQ
ncbi:MAG: LamG domain-containing protein [Sedimentisphaerales bacterium]|nr:LamG domain-containing protein [Sedimentisphaerales bacterium]